MLTFGPKAPAGKTGNWLRTVCYPVATEPPEGLRAPLRAAEPLERLYADLELSGREI